MHYPAVNCQPSDQNQTDLEIRAQALIPARTVFKLTQVFVGLCRFDFVTSIPWSFLDLHAYQAWDLSFREIDRHFILRNMFHGTLH